MIFEIAFKRIPFFNSVCIIHTRSYYQIALGIIFFQDLKARIKNFLDLGLRKQ